MSKVEYDPHLADLKGSEQHADLKNQPGEKGDPDHAEGDGQLTGDLAKQVNESDADTQIADELKDITDET